MSSHPSNPSDPAGDGGSDPLLGRTLNDRYVLRRKLGEGGMGCVYLAEDSRLRRQVAVKMMSAALSQQTEFRSRFQREALLQAQAAHPGIIQVLDMGECDDGAYIVLEYSEGRSLRELLKRGPLRLARALDLIEQLLEVLEFAHRSGIIHRDLKPTNILVEREGSGRERVRVLDFGLAKLLTGGGTAQTGMMTQQLTLTRPGSAFGTLEYMAPEQAAGEEVDHRADLYAVGVILYEILSGKPPIRDRTPSGYLRKLFAEPVPHLHESHPHLNVPEEIASLIAWSLEKDPADRPNSAIAFLETLRSYRNRAHARTSAEIPKTEPDRIAVAPPAPSRSAAVFSFLGWMLAVAGMAGAAFLWHTGQKDRDEVQGLRKEVASAQASLAKAGFAKGSLDEGISEMARRRTIDLEEGKQKVATLNLALGESRAHVKHLEAELGNLREAATPTAASGDGLGGASDARLGELERERKRLEADFKKERERAVDLQRRLQMLQGELSEMASREKTSRQEKLALQKSLERSKAEGVAAAQAGAARELAKVQAESASLREQIRGYEASLESLRTDSERMRQQLQQEQRREKESSDRAQQLAGQLADREREVAELRRQISRRPEIRQPKLTIVNEAGVRIRIERIEVGFVDKGGRFRTLTLDPPVKIDLSPGERHAPRDPARGFEGNCVMVTIHYKSWNRTSRRLEHRSPVGGSTSDGSNPGVFVIRPHR